MKQGQHCVQAGMWLLYHNSNMWCTVWCRIDAVNEPNCIRKQTVMFILNFLCRHTELQSCQAFLLLCYVMMDVIRLFAFFSNPERRYGAADHQGNISPGVQAGRERLQLPWGRNVRTMSSNFIYLLYLFITTVRLGLGLVLIHVVLYTLCNI